jgi:uncharacterized protein YecE (DUF72 family)
MPFRFANGHTFVFNISMRSGNIHIGTSGWSYKDWKASFYPPKLPPAGYLHYYSQHFEVVEINNSFYHLPSISSIETWKKSVEPSFLFCPKVSRFITHIKRLTEPETTLPPFFERMLLLEPQLGPFLIQLPPSLAFDMEVAGKFFEELRARYGSYAFALEARHASWMTEEAIDLLRRMEIAWVIADSGKRFIRGAYITSPHIYIRFHGPDGSYATSYTEAAMKAYAEKISEWVKQGHTVWAFFNNTDHEYALENARTLANLLHYHPMSPQQKG